MMFLFYIVLAFLFTYGILMGYYHSCWREIPEYSSEDLEKVQPAISISVIIAARNEENNIGKCLNGLLLQNYPIALLEIIVVDDHSTDNTARVVQSFQSAHLKLISLQENSPADTTAPKKKAIERGIAAASNELIVTTDADCIAGPEWLAAIAGYYLQTDNVFIAAPVKMRDSPTLLSRFQALDFLTMQGITGAAVFKRFHNMCNGANLAYEKKVFYEVGGFNGIDDIASGDDMLLMHKIAQKYPQQIGFLKSREAMVVTQPAASWKEFFNQRIRWASKATRYPEPAIIWVLLLVYLLNLILVSFIPLAVFHPFALLFFVILCLAKFFLEIIFVKDIAGFFNQSYLLPYLLLLQPLHILYIVVSGFFGQFKTYEWKGRKLH